MTPSDEFTQQLRRLDPDDPHRYDGLIDLAYDELLRIAHNLLLNERGDHTLRTTDLVHESFLKLTGMREMQWRDRQHFYAFLTRAMKQILIDHARSRKRQKRGGGAPHVSLDDAPRLVADEAKADEILIVSEAVERLSAVDPQGKQIFEYLYYLGLTHEEIADLMGVSTKTIQRKRRHIEAWVKAYFLKE